jgi:hypothetical protein
MGVQLCDVCVRLLRPLSHSVNPAIVKGNCGCVEAPVSMSVCCVTLVWFGLVRFRFKFSTRCLDPSVTLVFCVFGHRVFFRLAGDNNTKQVYIPH